MVVDMALEVRGRRWRGRVRRRGEVRERRKSVEIVIVALCMACCGKYSLT